MSLSQQATLSAETPTLILPCWRVG